MNALAEWKSQDTTIGRLDTSAAFNFAAAGKNQEALDILEHAFEEHNLEMSYIGVSVHYRSLRDEPRFRELLRRMDLPAS